MKKLLACAALLATSQGAFAALSNASFESGFADWSVADAQSAVVSSFGSYMATDGQKFAVLAGRDVLTRSFYGDNEGLLSFDFSIASASAVPAMGELLLLVGGSEVARFSFLGDPWQRVSWALPQSFNDDLEFRLASPNGNQRVLFDNFTVAPVPEPETWALMGLGLTGLIAARRRRAKGN